MMLVLASLFIAAEASILVLPLAVKGDPDIQIVDRVNKELWAGIEAQPDARAVEDNEVQKQVKESPGAAAKRCNGAAKCLAMYGKKAKVDRVLYGVATLGADLKVNVDFKLVSSLEAEVMREMTLSFAKITDVRKTIQDNAARLVALDVGDMPDLQVVMPIKKKKEPEPVAAAATPKPIEAAPDDIALSPIKHTKTHEAPPPRSRMLLYAGIAIAGLGAVGLGTAGYLGGSGLAMHGTIDRDGPGTTPQTEAEATNRRANQQLFYANVAWVAGGVTLGVGAALIVLDVILDMRAKPTLSVSANGATAGWEFEW